MSFTDFGQRYLLNLLTSFGEGFYLEKKVLSICCLWEVLVVMGKSSYYTK